MDVPKSINFLRNMNDSLLAPPSAHDYGRPIRAARGLLAWNAEELASEAGVGIVTVHQSEAGINQPRRATLDVIRRAFEEQASSLSTRMAEARACAYDSV